MEKSWTQKIPATLETLDCQENATERRRAEGLQLGPDHLVLGRAGSGMGAPGHSGGRGTGSQEGRDCRGVEPKGHETQTRLQHRGVSLSRAGGRPHSWCLWGIFTSIRHPSGSQVPVHGLSRLGEGRAATPPGLPVWSLGLKLQIAPSLQHLLGILTVTGFASLLAQPFAT